MSLEQDEKEIAAKADVAPRVSLKDLKDFITNRYVVNGADLAQCMNLSPCEQLAGLTLAICVCKNGYVLIGTSAVADVANYNKEIGERIAFEHVLHQLWPLLGFQLRSKLQSEDDAKKALGGY